MREQPAALKHVADAPPQGHRVGRAHVLAFDGDVAVVRLDQAVGEPQQRGLARARAADDREKFAALDMKRDVIDGLDAAAIKTLADVVEDDQGGNLHLCAGIARGRVTCETALTFRLPRHGLALNLSFEDAKAVPKCWLRKIRGGRAKINK